MTINNQLITDKKVIAEYFNSYYVIIGSSLAVLKRSAQMVLTRQCILRISPNGIDPSVYIKDQPKWY